MAATRVFVGMMVMLLLGCTPAASGSSPGQSVPSSTASVASAEPSATPSAVASVTDSVPPGSVNVTFRITLTGTVPSNAAFAIQSGAVGMEGGAIYLCSYYGGWPVCKTGASYEEVLTFLPGTRVQYRFWRELNVNGSNEEIKTAEITVSSTDMVVAVTYHFPPGA